MNNLPKPYFDIPFETYWYDSQFVKFLVQFMAIFDGMQVKIGKNNFDSKTDKIYVPIRRGNADRVVNYIISKGSTNIPVRVPLFTAEIVQIDKNQERAKGRNAINRQTVLPEGGAFPDDLKVVKKRTPTPYTLHFELCLLTSNDDHKFQIIEQILTLFDPDIQIQITDDPYDWNKLSALILDNINLETNYPALTDPKIIVTTFNFSSVVYLQTPVEFKTNFIKSIQLKFNALESSTHISNDYLNTNYDEIANISELDELNNLKS